MGWVDSLVNHLNSFVSIFISLGWYRTITFFVMETTFETKFGVEWVQKKYHSTNASKEMPEIG